MFKTNFLGRFNAGQIELGVFSKKYLAEHVTSKGGPTSNQRNKDKRALRRERKALDKAYLLN